MRRFYPGVQVLGVSALYAALTGDEEKANQCAKLALICQEEADRKHHRENEWVELRVWTGATLVREMADKLRDAGVEVTLEGTEYVYICGRRKQR